MTNSLEAFRYYSLGVEKAQSLRNDEAVSLLQKAVALDPNFAMAYARLGYVNGVTGNAPDKAKPYLEKAFQFSDRLTEKDKLQIQAWYAIVNYDYAGAIDAFRKIVAAYPLEVEAYRRLALLLKGEVRYQEALEVLKQALVIDAADKDLYNALCLIYSEMGDHQDALAMAQHYVQLAPGEPNAHDSLGLTYEWAGRYDEAILEYQRALALKPDFEIAMVHLGNVYFQQGRYQAAVEEYQRYLSAAPTDVERARGYSVIGYVELKRGGLAAAERAASQALKYNKLGNGLPYILALERNDLPKATKLEAEMENTGANERGIRASLRPFYYCRGILALKSNAVDEAIEDFKQAIGHRPQTWNLDASEDCLANAYLELRRFDEAIAEYQRIEKLNPNYPLLHYHLAEAYEQKGLRDQARAEYQEFLRVWKAADVDVPEVIAARKSLATALPVS
jgi:tetratricopeptide (TPR) repeat protein